MDTTVSPPAATPDIPEIIRRYRDGESIQSLAAEFDKCYRTIYNWLLKECGPEYEELVTEALIGRIADADQALENAMSKIQVARAREMARYARMDLERRRPKLYGPKQEINTDMQVTVVIEAPPHIDKPASIIDATAQVIDNKESVS